MFVINVANECEYVYCCILYYKLAKGKNED